MSDEKIINIARDFSKTPAGRYLTDGPFSGEHFRESVLLPALQTHELLKVDLDGTLGYGSSFLEEAFGGFGEVFENGHGSRWLVTATQCQDQCRIENCFGKNIYIS